jgi:bifunctional NMN adenylyltransferase/nudix hydrolase
MTREYAYDFAVFVGRFQPLHIGHQHVIERALQQAQTLIILIGSADSARSIQNPFTYDERRHFIEACYRHEMATGRIVVAGVFDRHYNDDAWIADIQRIVSALVLKIGNHGGVGLHGTADFKVGLAGYKKDGSSYYLKMFPDWGAIDIPSQYGTFNSTDIRDHYFRRSPSLPHDICSLAVVDILKEFRLRPEFSSLVEEREFMDAYKASWAGSPFPPVFVTVDAVTVQSGHVLLVRRGQQPGKGLFAIPGGFVNPDETLRESAVRELKEETMISDGKGEIPPAMLRSFIDETATRVFDYPHRSIRGRVITHAFLFRCPDRRTMFKVKGADDAASAAWYRLGDLKPNEFFEDHWSILTEMIGL